MARIGTISLVSDLKKKFGLTTFVETGTFRGESVEDAIAMGFERVCTCDINPEYIVSIKERFPQVEGMVGESPDALKRMLPYIDGPTLFWLDAHLPLYHDCEEQHQTARFPLREELDVIKQLKRGLRWDVIMCDDVNTITKNNPHGYTEKNVAPDQLIHFIDFNELRKCLEETHTCEVYPGVGHGLMVFIPR